MVEDLKKHSTGQEVILVLRQKGVSAHYAQKVILNVQKDRASRRQFKYTLGLGIMMVLAGSVLNYGLHIIGLKNTVVLPELFWCIVALGSAQIFRAFILFR